jgi:hypothetical protein
VLMSSRGGRAELSRERQRNAGLWGRGNSLLWVLVFCFPTYFPGYFVHSESIF